MDWSRQQNSADFHSKINHALGSRWKMREGRPKETWKKNSKMKAFEWNWSHVSTLAEVML